MRESGKGKRGRRGRRGEAPPDKWRRSRIVLWAVSIAADLKELGVLELIKVAAWPVLSGAAVAFWVWWGRMEEQRRVLLALALLFALIGAWRAAGLVSLIRGMRQRRRPASSAGKGSTRRKSGSVALARSEGVSRAPALASPPEPPVAEQAAAPPQEQSGKRMMIATKNFHHSAAGGMILKGSRFTVEVEESRALEANRLAVPADPEPTDKP